MANELITFEEEDIDAPLTDEERYEHELRMSNILKNMSDIANISMTVWRDLQWIRENKTYRDKYLTFNEFCKGELGRDNSAIYRGLKDAEFKEQLLLDASSDAERASILSLREGNTRFIRTLPEEAQLPFWKLTFALGSEMLAKKEDGSIEPTTPYMEALASDMNEILEHGGLHINGEFVSVESVVSAAQIEGVDEASAKAILLRAGVSESAYEALQRQAQHIKEKSIKADVTHIKGYISTKVDTNGSSYPVLTDSRGNEYDLYDILLSFNNRFLSITLKSPIRDLSDYNE